MAFSIKLLWQRFKRDNLSLFEHSVHGVHSTQQSKFLDLLATTEAVNCNKNNNNVCDYARFNMLIGTREASKK